MSQECADTQQGGRGIGNCPQITFTHPGVGSSSNLLLLTRCRSLAHKYLATNFRYAILTSAVLLVCMQQAPLFEISSHPCWKESDKLGGYITVVVLPAHVASEERILRVTWTLLTLPMHLDLSIKAFKVA